MLAVNSSSRFRCGIVFAIAHVASSVRMGVRMRARVCACVCVRVCVRACEGTSFLYYRSHDLAMTAKTVALAICLYAGCIIFFLFLSHIISQRLSSDITSMLP